MNIWLKNHLIELWGKRIFPHSSMIKSNNIVVDYEIIKDFINYVLKQYTNVSFENNTDIFSIVHDLTEEDSAKSIPIDNVRKLKDHFNSKSGITPFRFGLIVGADYLNINSSNSLLKILEEPPQNSYLILLVSNPNNLLPTILSRVVEIKNEGKYSKSDALNISMIAKLLNPDVRFEDKKAALDEISNPKKTNINSISTLLRHLILSAIKRSSLNDFEYTEFVKYIENKNIPGEKLLEYLEKSIILLENSDKFSLDHKHVILLVISNFLLLG